MTTEQLGGERYAPQPVRPRNADTPTLAVSSSGAHTAEEEKSSAPHGKAESRKHGEDEITMRAEELVKRIEEMEERTMGEEEEGRIFMSDKSP